MSLGQLGATLRHSKAVCTMLRNALDMSGLSPTERLVLEMRLDAAAALKHALALVVLAVYVRLEWRAHSDELERSWQRERGGE